MRSYPRIVGETGGKDFVVAHPDCDRRGLLVALLRGAFEFQGQKCSAASRAYVPKTVWEGMGNELVSEIEKIKMGDASDFSNFMTVQPTMAGALGKFAAMLVKLKGVTASTNPSSGRISVVLMFPSGETKGWYWS